jgi:hypothetical protein
MDPAPAVSRTEGFRRRRLLAALAGVVALLVVAVPVAWASHQFIDVPDGHQFHTEIGAIADAGITSGKACVGPGTPLTFCPNEPVVRQSMAAFMHRGLGRAGFGQGSGTLTNGSLTDLAVVEIEVGGVPGGTQFVQLSGDVGAIADPASGCPCLSVFTISQDGVGVISQQRFVTNDQTAGVHAESAAVSAVAIVPSGSTQSFRLQGFLATITEVSVFSFGAMTALVVPLGSTGGNTLGNEAAGTTIHTPFSPP